MSKPKVSIVCITYNQQEFITKTIDSFLMQKTDFPIEIIIADDASTDKTQKIIKQYVKKHPDVIVPILRKKNVGVGVNLRDALEHATGDYIAMCEGDDYWTASDKLKKQASYLDAHENHMLCFHTTRVIYEDGKRDEYLIPSEKGSFTLDRLIKGNYIHTSSVMYRRKSYGSLPTNMLPIDWYLHLMHAKVGKIGFINKEMSVYRRNEGSVWFPVQGEMDSFWLKRGIGHAIMFEAVHELFADTKHKKTVEGIQNNWTRHLIELDGRYNAGLTVQLCESIPAATSRYIQTSSQDMQHLKNELNEVYLQTDLIKKSIFWRIRNKVAVLMGKEVI